jgi:hypothetical protein
MKYLIVYKNQDSSYSLSCEDNKMKYIGGYTLKNAIKHFRKEYN